jgi:hypothetical protein
MRQQLKPAVQTRGHAMDPEGANATSREFDGESNAVQPSTDLRHDRGIRIGQFVSIRGSRRSLHE